MRGIVGSADGPPLTVGAGRTISVIACEILRFAQNDAVLLGITCIARTTAIHFARETLAGKSRSRAGSMSHAITAG